MLTLAHTQELTLVEQGDPGAGVESGVCHVQIYIANHYHGTVVFNRPHQKWQVWTPLLGAPEGRRYLVAGCRSRERAEAIRAKYVPLLRAADEAGTIEEQLPVYLDEIRAQVRRTRYVCRCFDA